MTYCVGLTGNIASGKSKVALLFGQFGIDVINADAISRQLTLKDTAAFNEITARYGSLVINDEGQLNRHALRDIIFSNADERHWLEELLHPNIRKEIERQVTLSSSSYCIVEIPLLKDKKNYPYLSRVLVVTSPVAVQIKRMMRRDQCTEAQALAIIATQPSQEERLALADDVLINNNTLVHLKKQVQMLHKKYLHLSHNFG